MNPNPPDFKGILHKHIVTCTKHVRLLGPFRWIFQASSLIQSRTVTHLRSVRPTLPSPLWILLSKEETAVEVEMLHLHCKIQKVKLLLSFICICSLKSGAAVSEHRKAQMI